MYAAVEAPGQASPSATPIKVMIVDDSAVVRGPDSRWVEEEAGLEVVSRHANGRLAVDDIAQSAPDIVLLDIEMPEMDGLQALPLLLAARPGTRVLMVSTLTRRNAEISFKALALWSMCSSRTRIGRSPPRQFEVQRGLPVPLLVKYFNKAGSAWEIRPEIRRKVEFRAHNLLNDSQALGIFGVIFCRNVLMYFDDATKRAVLASLASRLAPDGYLVLGAAETNTGASDAFRPMPEGHRGIFGFTPQAADARRRQTSLDKAEAAWPVAL
jgi:CheY-like chemotaxis protein